MSARKHLSNPLTYTESKFGEEQKRRDALVAKFQQVHQWYHRCGVTVGEERFVEVPGKGRFRVSAYASRGTAQLAKRVFGLTALPM